MKKAALMVLGTAMQTYGEKLTSSRKCSWARPTSSSMCSRRRAWCCGPAERAQRASPGGVHVPAAQVFINDAAGRVEMGARTALAAMAEGDTLRTMLAALRRMLKFSPVNTVALRRQVADAVLARKAYPF